MYFLKFFTVFQKEEIFLFVLFNKIIQGTRFELGFIGKIISFSHVYLN